MSYYLWLALYWLANHLPERVGCALFALIGRVTFLVARRWRANALDNMRHVLRPPASQREVEQTAQAAVVHQFTNYWYMLRPPVSDDRWPGGSTVDGWEHLDQAVARGRGVILISAHFGSPEHLADLLRRERGLRPLAPAETIRPEKLYHWFVAVRERRGGRGIPADQSALELIRALRRGEVIAVAADLDTTRQGEPTEFFGAPAQLPQGMGRLALMTGAAVVPVFVVRRPDWTFHTVFEPPLVFERTGDREADLRRALRQLAQVMERWIRAYPTQWTQFNPIWQWANVTESPASGIIDADVHPPP
ncbi:MAG: lysophospholipid acyltransferase family protein [Anaerolineae bacterium]|nr:lysophospholipid acyltransferase family protein [Anaerolineae bacterium]